MPVKSVVRVGRAVETDAQEGVQGNRGGTCSCSEYCGRTTLVSGVGGGNVVVIAGGIPDLKLV